MSSEPKHFESKADGPERVSHGHERQALAAFRRWRALFSLLAITLAMALILSVVLSRPRRSAFAQNASNYWAGNTAVFTPAHAAVADALKEYVGWQPTPVQPIAFNHKIHLQNNIECANCHEGVAQGPNAGIPSVSFCMACHQAVAMDNPEIKKLAAYADKGQDVPWQRVYWFYPETHVRFWHSPHINAGVNCKECHGDLSQQTVAVRSKDLTMNFCLTCHRAKGVSVDCSTCHY